MTTILIYEVKTIVLLFQTVQIRNEFDRESQSKKNASDPEFILGLTAKLSYFCDVQKDGQRLVNKFNLNKTILKVKRASRFFLMYNKSKVLHVHVCDRNSIGTQDPTKTLQSVLVDIF